MIYSYTSYIEKYRKITYLSDICYGSLDKNIVDR